MDTDTFSSTLRHIRNGWLPAHIFSDPAIFEMERQRLFARSWQFLAHVSEVPQRGDYVVRRILDDSFIVIRGDDGEIRVLLNMCRHRGMQVCRTELGHAKRLVCPYHMWSYRNDGSLVGVPFHNEAYGGEDVLPRGEMGLLQPPATAFVHGMVMVNLDPDAPPVDQSVGAFMPYLAFYLAPSAAGVEFRGPQRWRFKANWKISSENFGGDIYHTPHTHASVAEIGVMPNARAGERKAGAVYYAGHGAGASFKLPEGSFEERLRWIGYTDPQIAQRWEHWPDSIRQMVAGEGLIPSAATLFPNLSMLHLWAKTDDAGTVAPFTTVRLWQPVSAEETEALSWFVVDKDAPEAFKAASYKAYLMSFGSSGMFEQDDMENWSLATRMARGTMGRRVLLHNRMGLTREGRPVTPEHAGFAGPGVARIGFTEQNQRHWLRVWSEFMAREPVAMPPIGASMKDCMDGSRAP